MKNNIKKYRLEKHLTQEKMSKMLNVSRQSYIKYESGESEPSFETLKKISSILETSIDKLLNNELYMNDDQHRYKTIIDEIKLLLKNLNS